ncbi:LPS export ABC transporter permease LptG [uncultured Aquabacterium sp.]|uniref:LPS export ABC transporter permease LptG n=1 Tax=Aquabacterium sp. TaxID=1872578 RepID=UPI0025DFE443|nr:LPS export ABC transporter permease LptG [uncultured Aquabacterium sp.]
MRTVRRLIFGTVVRHVALVAIAFSALFFFIDFVDEVRNLGRLGYQLHHVLWTCVLMQGSHLYDLFPISLLIGAILALSRLAQTSEFTILRTGGLGPGRALGLLGLLGVGAAGLMIFIGNWYVPWSEEQLQVHKAQFSTRQGLKLGQSGAWLRERRPLTDGGHHLVTVSVGKAMRQDQFGDVRIFEFDQAGRLLRRVSAREAVVTPGEDGNGSVWHLREVNDTVWLTHDRLGEGDVQQARPVVRDEAVDELAWQSSLTPLVVSASVLPPDTMSTMALWRYTRHLASNAQAAQRYEIEFWKKTFYPIVCLVMVALALPFAYLHARSGGMSLKIFGGIMLGISFVLANHISSHLGLLHQWQPWLAAAAPSALYLLLSMSAFVWLVRYR